MSDLPVGASSGAPTSPQEPAAQGRGGPVLPPAAEPGPAAEQRPAKRGRGCLIAVVLVLVLLVAASVAVPLIMVALLSGKGTGDIVRGGNVALIRIDGVITATDGDDGLFGTIGTSSESVLKQIDRAEESSKIKAILLRIDSPGGTAAGGQEIADAVRDAEKPVVASVADLGASAAYMIASQSDRIVCNRAGLVGSIGVIMEIPNYEGLYDKLGIKVVTLHEGEYKDIGSPARPMLPEEREFLQKMLKVVHEQFIADVARGRKLPVSKVRELASGLFWTGEQAKDLKLVDEVGGYREAVAAAAELGGIEGKPQVVEMKPTGFWGYLSEDFATTLARELAARMKPGETAPRIR